MPKITNESYLKFLKTGMIDLVSQKELDFYLDNIKWTGNVSQAKAFLVLLYYSGRRPAEIINLTGKHFGKSKGYLQVLFEGKKKGRPSTLFFPLKYKHIRWCWDEIIKKVYPEQFVFWNLRSHSEQRIKKEGQRTKIYPYPTNKICLWIKRWTGLPAYFFRHNRFSYMAQKGARIDEMRYVKGGGSLDYYTHLSSESAKRVAKYLK